ncbi:MAG: protease, partial [Bacteroidales bacterium]|nr:protease [Bacteroidales bacterium]
MKNFTRGLFLKTGIGFFIAFFMSLSINVNSQETTPILRFPDIHKDKVVFTAEEDLWIAPVDGGEARRLTIHDGEETTPKFSPDGSRIAFTAEYDGNKDVYVMNSKGGDITRLTYHPSYDEVLGWHPAQNKIMFRSTRQLESGIETQRIFMISPEGGFPKPLKLIEAARGSFSADGQKIAFNKTSRSGRTWKRYQGGRAQEVYLYNLETDGEKQLTDFEGTDRFPMWIGNKIYFTSDRDRHLNLYSVDENGQNIKQLTKHDTYDARFPSAGKEKIVYEHGGDIFA